ncbi:hypothetical protein [Streptomyces sp. NPDC046887]|uniref:hypothetical protein n=1 Tax=Streptomyces sp. NPDC046887 TaxID=3155472 RepID=UPI0033D11A7C
MNRKTLLRPAAGLLAACGLAAALLVGSAATAQAGEATPRCPGGCAQTDPAGFQVSSAPVTATPDGNWEPH